VDAATRHPAVWRTAVDSSATRDAAVISHQVLGRVAADVSTSSDSVRVRVMISRHAADFSLSADHASIMRVPPRPPRFFGESLTVAGSPPPRTVRTVSVR
jgi:hypothetical protein